MGTENLRLEGLSQPDSRMGWHGRGVVKARSSEQVLSCGGGARPARGSQCISGLHPSGPHLSVRIDALLAPLLLVALGVEGQLVGAHLHLAWQQEPRSLPLPGPVLTMGLLSQFCSWLSSQKGKLLSSPVITVAHSYKTPPTSQGNLIFFIYSSICR